MKFGKIMPWLSNQQRKWGHTSEGEKALGGVSKVHEWDKATKGMHLPARAKKKKLKPKIVINNKMKALGQMDTKTNKIEINVKKHQGDKRQLTDTIKHELYHVNHPQATEKETYKNTGKIEDITPQEQQKYLAKLRMKKINYKSGALKRKFRIKRKVEMKPGDFITKMNESKIKRKVNNKQISRKERISIMGLV